MAVELSAKRWKMMQLVGFFVCVGGVTWFMSGNAFGFFVLLLGLLIFCIGRILAWWFHG